MNLLNEKLEAFTTEDLDELIEQHKSVEYPIKPSSIKKMYSNWLRSDDPIGFRDLFKKKIANHRRKMKKAENEFCSMQVGWIEFNYDEPSYWVHLHGEQPYKIRWLDGLGTLALMEESVLKFCKTNSVKLKKSGQPNIKVIQTVFSS